MAVIKITLDDTTYEVDPDKLTLGEARVLKRDYGMQTLGQLNFGDPDQMVGILVIAVKRANPELGDDEVRAQVEALDFVHVVEGISPDEPAPKGRGRKKAGGPATTPVTSGDQS